MTWPAFFLDNHRADGTCYVPSARIPALLEKYKTGTAWKFHNRFTSYQPSRGLVYKSVDTLAPESEEDFWHIMESAKAAGCGPPSSFSDLYRKVAPYAIPLASVSNWIRPAVFGGWQTATPGTYTGVWQYDLVSAYRSAALAGGLPDTRYAHPTERIGSEWFGLYAVELRQGSLPYALGAQRGIVTREEIEAYRIRPLRVLKGIRFDRTVELDDTFRMIDTTFPYCHKRISRAFWGMWNSPSGPEQLGLKSGSSRTLRNPFYNPVWAAYVTSRVKMRLARYQEHAVQMFVDSVWLERELDAAELGDQVGQFRLVRYWPSLWVKYAGAYGGHRERV